MTLSRDPESEKHRKSPQGPDRTHLGLGPGMAGLLDLMNRLLAEDGCPWDRAQTLDSLRPYLLEETYEVAEAMDEPERHRAELGDLLFQIVFHSALREREGEFDFAGVIESITAKMVRRHPHVFSEANDPPGTAEEVARRWRAHKATERGEVEARPWRVPDGLPGLERAARVQLHASELGFDWPDLEGPRRKVDEELAELDEAIDGGDGEAIEEELGDLFFVLVRMSQKLEVDPDRALRRAVRKFERRFFAVWDRCREEGIETQQAGLARLERYWNDVKARRVARD